MAGQYTLNIMTNIFDLSGKVAVVTGASSGLGVQFAYGLADAGADVGIWARRYDKLLATKLEIEAKGKKCVAVKCDVTQEKEIVAAVEETVKRLGKIDILVNNAGVSAIAPAETMTEADWDKVLNTNLKAVFLVAKNVGQQMIKQKYGRIINTASIYGLVGNNAFTVVNYHASKGGVVNFTRALAAEWAKYNITVNAIAPGFFESEMTRAVISDQSFLSYVKGNCPMQRIGKQGELNGALIYLASDASSYTTGQTIAVDGGWTSI